MSADIIVQGCSLSFTLDSKLIFDRADFDIARGQRVGLVGSNGSGKTTLMRLISGLVAPDNGTVLLFGEPSHRASPANRRRTSLFLGGDASLYGSLTAEENIRYFAELAGMKHREAKAATKEIMKSLNVDWFSTKKVRDMSRGMRQRVALARSMVHKPDLLLLDEPTTGMDIDGLQLFGELIASAAFDDTSILISGHNAYEIVSHCADYWVLWERGVTSSNRHSLDELPPAPAADALRQAMTGFRHV
ncbi:ABC transporter ATP-binding protein [Rhodococcus sp. BGS-1C]|uniref:ABC transporter ATP-binding protein n=1 Tax=unclassified Rhodococcus (in: high G+C Gram-positive bacteria) TaxID=192944 RepID=UPI0019CFFC96|nr:ABC transporter ATP-binding protein [Rhodococcus sp. KRD197]